MLSISSKKLKKDSSSASSASTVGNNSNLLVDILYRLPVKPLRVFKAVSKQWQALISDPCFERNYNLRSRRLSKPAVLFVKDSTEFETLVMGERKGIDDYVFNASIAVNMYSVISFAHSCNGLILFKVHEFRIPGTYVIYNPSMKHCETLPSLPLRKTRVPVVFSATIAFDPAKSSYYDVVAVCMADTGNMNQIEIYSSKTDSWRAAGDPFPLGGFLSGSGVYWNGSVHWIDWRSATLHYFDIDCELMKKIAMPTQPYPLYGGDCPRKIVYFCECKGQVHLMELRKDGKPRYDIWELRTDYTGWNFKYCVDLTSLIAVYSDDIFYWSVLHVEEGEDSPRLIWADKDKVISFDLKNKSSKKMCDANLGVWVHGFQYMETLAHAWRPKPLF